MLLVPLPCQVAACLLLFLEEDDAFWMMCAIVEDLLPASYFSTTLLGVQTDQRVLRHLIVQYLPRLDRLLQEHDIGEGPTCLCSGSWGPSSGLGAASLRPGTWPWTGLAAQEGGGGVPTRGALLLSDAPPPPWLTGLGDTLLSGGPAPTAPAPPQGPCVCLQSCRSSRCTGSSRPSPVWCTSACCCASGTCFSTRAPWCCSRPRWACCASR